MSQTPQKITDIAKNDKHRNKNEHSRSIKTLHTYTNTGESTKTPSHTSPMSSSRKTTLWSNTRKVNTALPAARACAMQRDGGVLTNVMTGTQVNRPLLFTKSPPFHNRLQHTCRSCAVENMTVSFHVGLHVRRTVAVRWQCTSPSHTTQNGSLVSLSSAAGKCSARTICTKRSLPSRASAVEM